MVLDRGPAFESHRVGSNLSANKKWALITLPEEQAVIVCASCCPYSKLNLKKKERKEKITKIFLPSSRHSCEPGSEEGQDTWEDVLFGQIF